METESLDVLVCFLANLEGLARAVGAMDRPVLKCRHRVDTKDITTNFPDVSRRFSHAKNVNNNCHVWLLTDFPEYVLFTPRIGINVGVRLILLICIPPLVLKLRATQSHPFRFSA